MPTEMRRPERSPIRGPVGGPMGVWQPAAAGPSGLLVDAAAWKADTQQTIRPSAFVRPVVGPGKGIPGLVAKSGAAVFRAACWGWTSPIAAVARGLHQQAFHSRKDAEGAERAAIGDCGMDARCKNIAWRQPASRI